MTLLNGLQYLILKLQKCSWSKYYCWKIAHQRRRRSRPLVSERLHCWCAAPQTRGGNVCKFQKDVTVNVLSWIKIRKRVLEEWGERVVLMHAIMSLDVLEYHSVPSLWCMKHFPLCLLFILIHKPTHHLIVSICVSSWNVVFPCFQPLSSDL